MLPYAIRQLVWMLTSALKLIYALSTGVIWVSQMLRLFLYGACAAICFVPHWWWYLTSPNIVRRVSYRFSETTKRRYIVSVLKAEGVDLHAMPRRCLVQTTQPLLTPNDALAARRRRRPATSAATRQKESFMQDTPDSTQSREKSVLDRRLMPHRCLSVSSIPSSAAYREGDHQASSVDRLLRATTIGHSPHHAVDGEVDDRALFQMSPSSLGPPQRRGASGAGHAQRTLHDVGNKALGRYPDTCDDADVESLPLQGHRRLPPFSSALTESRRGDAQELSGTSFDVTATEQPTYPSTCCTNTDGESHGRNFSLRRPQPSRTHPHHIHGSSSCSSAAAGDPRKHPCDVSQNEGVCLHAAPAASLEKPSGRPHFTGNRQGVGGFEGCPVHYEVLPKQNPSSDPMLRDVLALFGEEVSEMPLEPSKLDKLSTVTPRRRRRRGGPPRPPQARGAPAVHEPMSLGPGTSHGSIRSREDQPNDVEEEDEEDRLNLHNRATVDVVLPIPLDALMKAPGDARQHKQVRRKRFPIAINVSGAAWIIGSHLWSTMMARVLAQRGYVVFCPDYRNFPQTTMEGMTLDISDAVAWVLNNAERYNGDLSNVTLIGHSAGAHLTMMSLLSQAQLSAYQYNAEQGIHEGVPPPSDVAYNVPRYNPRESIHRYVGISGIFNVRNLVKHFDKRGLYRNVLYQIAGGKAQMARYSIHAYFDDRRGGDTGEVLPDNIFDFLPQRMFFVHGDADKCAPLSESSSLVAMLRASQVRFTLRRSARNEEARRHAQRSRRFFSRSFGTAAGEVKSSVKIAATGVSPSMLANSGSETAAVEVVCDTEATIATAADEACAAGGCSCDDHEKITALDNDVVNTDTAPGVTQPQRQEEVHLMGAPSVAVMSSPSISPILFSAREDYLRRPVDIGFVVISGGRHLDAFVDECIAAGRSSCVDFLCDYESVIDFGGATTATSAGCRGLGLGRAADGTITGSVQTSPAPTKKSPSWIHVPGVSVIPDALLPLSVPHEERSLPLRLCTMVCPF